MNYALILAGGSGTRLWPMSRAGRPKQLLPLVAGQSLLRLAYDRLDGSIDIDRRYVCAGQRHAELVHEALPELPEACFLGEPEGRDTLAAIALGAAVLERRDPQAVVAVLTADHVIRPAERFRELLAAALALAAQGDVLLTFGVTPTHAATGFGYLELAEPLAGAREPVAAGSTPRAQRMAQFREKPDRATAEAFFAAGPARYLWNSGMFVWRAETLLACVARYEPAVHAGIAEIAAAWDTPDRAAVLARVYPALKKTSIDYAVMERAAHDPAVAVAALPLDLEWLDVGSWPAVKQILVADAAGNATTTGEAAARADVAGGALIVDSRNCLVAADAAGGRVVAVLGCDDLIVVHTPDATLVCRADRAEQIKDLSRQATERFRPELA